MADVVILHARDKDVAAARLEESVAAAGYAVERLADGPISAERVARTAALIVLWSKGAMASAEIQAAANRARSAGTLIEATADGIMPVPALDQPGAALISGWRGEPFHPGWQRIAAELKQICGTRRAQAPAPALAAAAVPAAATAGTHTRARRMLPLALAAILFAGLGAAAWFGTSSAPEQPMVATPAPAPTAPEEPVQFASAEELQPAPEEEAVAPPPAVPLQASPAPAPSARPVPRAAPARTRPRPTPPAANMRAYCAAAGRSADQCRNYRREDRRARRAEGERPVRYRNARNMRRFCAAAGRGTPQCRTFLRNTRD